MSVVRVKKRDEHPYVVLERETLRMAAVSLKARGLWALCMTYPDDWEFRPGHLARCSDRDGVTAIRSAMKELEAVGLAYLERVRRDDGTVRGTRWVIYETPGLNPHRDAENLNLGEGEQRVETKGPGRESGFPKLGKPETRATRDSGDRTLRSNEKACSNHVLLKKQQQHARGGGVVTVEDAATAVLDRSKCLLLLTVRGVDEPVAERLVRQYDAGHIRAMVERYDAEGGHGPGWLVAAVERGYEPLRNGTDGTPKKKELMTLAAARREYQELTGGGDPLRPFDRYFETVRLPDKTLFRRREVPV
ncbi:MAG: hypothetical protein ACE5G0_14970 [Rhodothermales bacterium]